MSRIYFRPQSSLQSTAVMARHWTPSLAAWGVGAGSAVLLILSVTPLMKREVLVKIPVVGSYWDDTIPASDSPF